MRKIIGYCFLICSLLTASCASMATKSETRQIQLTAQNTLIFKSEINAISLDVISAALVGKRMSLPPEEVLYFIIASPGGDYQDALTLGRVLSVIPNMTIICKECASAAGMILAGLSGRPKLILDNSEVFMHEMYLTKATAHRLSNPMVVVDLQRSSDDFNKVMYTAIGISKEAYEAKIVGKSWTLEGRDIIKYHLADELVAVSCDNYVSRMAPVTCNVPEEE